jgi:hypothetical protein
MKRLLDQGFRIGFNQRLDEELAASYVLIRDFGLPTVELRVSPSCLRGAAAPDRTLLVTASVK